MLVTSSSPSFIDEDDDLLLLIPSIITASGNNAPAEEISYFVGRIQGASVNVARTHFLDAIISPANAQFAPTEFFFDILAEQLDETSYRVRYLSNNELNVRDGTLNINGDTGDLIFDDVLSCEVGTSITASIQAISETSITLIFNFGTDDLGFIVPLPPVKSLLMPLYLKTKKGGRD